jgi:hypothetical protein
VFEHRLGQTIGAQLIRVVPRQLTPIGLGDRLVACGGAHAQHIVGLRKRHARHRARRTSRTLGARPVVACAFTARTGRATRRAA